MQKQKVHSDKYMKKSLSIAIITLTLFLLAGHWMASSVVAVDCTSIPVTGDYTVTASCTFPNSPIDGIDSGIGSTNTAKLTIGATGSLSVLNGQTLAVGSVESNLGGSITVVDGAAIKTVPIYVTDADSDGYASQTLSQSLTGTTRRNTVTAVTDCGDGDANAHPGQTTYYTTTFNNTVSADTTSYDWNCDGSETQQYATATYTCAGCTNGSGYASFQNTTNGYQTSVPACGVAGTYYTVTNATCLDPAVANCSTSSTNAQVTQPCR